MKILFVCTGNTCRSPMAEHIARKLFPEGYAFSSAGIYASGGEKASPAAIRTLKGMGIDLSTHSSRQLTPEMLEEADFILTMTGSHRQNIVMAFPRAADKVFTLCKMAGENGDVPDPYMQSDDIYEATAQRLESLIQKAIKNIQEKK